jgi:hypothetical protein
VPAALLSPGRLNSSNKRWGNETPGPDEGADQQDARGEEQDAPGEPHDEPDEQRDAA